MENNRLLQILQRTVSENEIDKLSAHTFRISANLTDL